MRFYDLRHSYANLLPALQRETADAWDRLAAGLSRPR